MSEIELGPFPKYETVRNNAYLSYIAIDSKFNLDSIDIGFYKEIVKKIRLLVLLQEINTLQVKK